MKNLLIFLVLTFLAYPLGDVNHDCTVDVYDVERVDHGLLYPDWFAPLDVDGDGNSDLDDLYTTIDRQGNRCRIPRWRLERMHLKERKLWAG